MWIRNAIVLVLIHFEGWEIIDRYVVPENRIAHARQPGKSDSSRSVSVIVGDILLHDGVIKWTVPLKASIAIVVANVTSYEHLSVCEGPRPGCGVIGKIDSV